MELGERLVIVVAVGKAAESATGCESALRPADRQFACISETTAVIVDICADGICATSVDTSQAWMRSDRKINDLTTGQRRKHVLGAGRAVPVSFCRSDHEGLRLVGSDGLYNY
jgi:hypothetical protein